MDLFGTAGIRGPADEYITPERALTIGRAIGMYVKNTPTRRVVVGRDGRVTSPTLARALVSGLESTGVPVVDAGQLPTPALAFGSRGKHGVMITASHNPPGHNGIKVFDDGTEYDRAAETEIEDIVRSAPLPTTWNRWSTSESIHLIGRYRDAIVEYATRWGATPVELSIVVDCGNGMASHATPSVLRSIGADVTTLNANIDGFFPGRTSKPTPRSIRDLRSFVGGGSYDLGIAHDGDADRIVIVDDRGDIVHEDTVLAILAEAYTRNSDGPDPVVVTTPNASARVDDRVTTAGGRVERVPLGELHEGISTIEEADQESTVVFAGEPWKHIHPELGGWIDGIASAAVVVRLVAEAGSIGTLRAPIDEKPYRKTDVRCPDEAKPTAMDALEESLAGAFDDATIDTSYGIRLDFPDGSWVLVRPSGTEACLRIYVESESVDDLLATTKDLVEAAVTAADTTDSTQ